MCQLKSYQRLYEFCNHVFQEDDDWDLPNTDFINTAAELFADEIDTSRGSLDDDPSVNIEQDFDRSLDDQWQEMDVSYNNF